MTETATLWKFLNISILCCFRKYKLTALLKGYWCGKTQRMGPVGGGGEYCDCPGESWARPLSCPSSRRPVLGLPPVRTPFQVPFRAHRPRMCLKKFNFKKWPSSSLISSRAPWITHLASSKWGRGQPKIDICQWSRLDCWSWAWLMLAGQPLSGLHSPHHWVHESSPYSEKISSCLWRVASVCPKATVPLLNKSRPHHFSRI